MRMKTILAVVTCAACVSWTRLTGQIKGINLKESSITLQNKSGDLFTVPIDYEVKIEDKDGTLIDIRRVVLDQKVVLTRTPMEKPVEDTSGMAQPEPSERGH